MPSAPSLLRFLPALAVLPLLAGCGTSTVTGHGQARLDHRVIAVVGDGSCDATPGQRAQAVHAVSLATRSAEPQHGTVLVDRVGRNALAAMTFAVQHDFA